MKTSLKRRDYHSYVWKRGELLFTLAQVTTLVLFLAFFFYRSILAALPLTVVGVISFRLLKERKTEKCKRELVAQFKECMLSVSASLRAGYAVENAFVESEADMCLLYGEQSLIYRELEVIRRGLVINITLEEMLTDLATRSECEEIIQFAQIFSVAKRSGGNLTEMIQNTTELIGQRIEVRQDIETILSGRRMEQRIMKCMPFVILLYISMTYPGYFDGLYHNLQGIAIMTGCLTMYLTAVILGDKIMERMEKEGAS